MLTVVDMQIRRGWPFVPHEFTELVPSPDITLARVLVPHDCADPADSKDGPQVMELIVEDRGRLADLRDHAACDERPEVLSSRRQAPRRRFGGIPKGVAISLGFIMGVILTGQGQVAHWVLFEVGLPTSRPGTIRDNIDM